MPVTEAIKVSITDPSIRKIVNATFPDYKGRKIRIEPATEVGLHDLNWCEGTRSQYRACKLNGEPTGGSDEYNAMAPWNNPAEGKRLPLPAGFAVVEHSIFCGRDCGLRIYVNPADLPKWLPR